MTTMQYYVGTAKRNYVPEEAMPVHISSQHPWMLITSPEFSTIQHK
jgi:hypothetical protein